MIEINTDSVRNHVKLVIYSEFELEEGYFEGVSYAYSFDSFKKDVCVGELQLSLENTIKKLIIPLFTEAKFIRFLDQKEFMERYGDKNEG